jgi:thiol-disulfide isomerase/thioredoxin
MKLYLKALVVTFIAAAALGGLFLLWQSNTTGKTPVRVAQIDEMENVGLPDFELKTLEDKAVKLSDFKGSVVIVSFWATWCAPCLEEFPSMIELVEKMDGKVKLLAVSEDSSKEEIEVFLKAFPRYKNPNILILWDEDRSVAQMYNAERLPESFVAGKDHRLVRKIVGSIDWASQDAITFMQELAKK